MKILGNFLPCKSLKFDYKQSKWMNSNFFSALRKRAKLTKLFTNYIHLEKQISNIEIKEVITLLIFKKLNLNKAHR